MTWWIPLIFVLGLVVAILGLIPSIQTSRAQGSVTPGLIGFGLFTVLFGWAVIQWILGPFPIRPRIVPYFTKEVGRLHGPTMTAFRRGRALYLNAVALERIAASAGVKPLSAFGFADDYYEQEVRWHSVAEGLATVGALRQGLAEELQDTEVVEDLEALAAVLGAAAAQGADFSLVLRLFAKANLQMVCTREARRGSFW